MYADSALLISALLFRVGQIFWNAGVSRSKNVVSAVTRQSCDAALAIVVCVIAMPFLAPEMGEDSWRIATLASVLITTSILPLATAERSTFFSNWPMTILLAGFILPFALGLIWTRYFPGIGAWAFLPMSCAIGAASAIASAWWIGPRPGRYHRDGSSSLFPPHQFLFVAVGAMLLNIAMVLGSLWSVSFTSDSCISALAGVGGAVLASVIWARIRFGKVDVWSVVSGLCAGAILIPSVGLLPPWMAILTGALAGLIGLTLSNLLDARLHVDDAGGQSMLWLIASLLGALVQFIHPPHALGRPGLWLTLGILIFAGIAFGLSISVLWLMNRFSAIRSREQDEYDGLDLAEHDVNAYPDFQQTTIKSYHTREA